METNSVLAHSVILKDGKLHKVLKLDNPVVDERAVHTSNYGIIPLSKIGRITGYYCGGVSPVPYLEYISQTGHHLVSRRLITFPRLLDDVKIHLIVSNDDVEILENKTFKLLLNKAKNIEWYTDIEFSTKNIHIEDGFTLIIDMRDNSSGGIIAFKGKFASSVNGRLVVMRNAGSGSYGMIHSSKFRELPRPPYLITAESGMMKEASLTDIHRFIKKVYDDLSFYSKINIPNEFKSYAIFDDSDSGIFFDYDSSAFVVKDVTADNAIDCIRRVRRTSSC